MNIYIINIFECYLSYITNGKEDLIFKENTCKCTSCYGYFFEHFMISKAIRQTTEFTKTKERLSIKVVFQVNIYI